MDTSVLLSDPGRSSVQGTRGRPPRRRHQRVSRANGITRSWAISARTALRLLDDLRIEHGWLDAPVPLGTEGRQPAGRFFQSHRPGRASLTDSVWGQRHASSRSPRISPSTGASSPSSARTCRCGSRRRRSGSTEEYRNEMAVESESGPASPRSTSPSEELDGLYANGRLGVGGRRRDALSHRSAVALAARLRARAVGADKQVRLVRGDRDAFGPTDAAPSSGSLSSCCSTPMSASSPGWPGRHRQVGARPVRRSRSGHGAAGASARHGLPPVVCRGRPGPRISPRDRGRRWGPGAGGVRHPLRRRQHRGRRGDPRPGAARGSPLTPYPRPGPSRRFRHRRRGAVARTQRLADGPVPDRPELQVVLTRRRPARQPASAGDGVAAVIETLKGHPCSPT